MKVPHKCPYCNLHLTPGKTGNDETCVPCSGTGIVWGDDGGAAPTLVPYPVYPPTLPWWSYPQYPHWYDPNLPTLTYCLTTGTQTQTLNATVKPLEKITP